MFNCCLNWPGVLADITLNVHISLVLRFFVQDKYELKDKMYSINWDNCISYLFVEDLRTISVSDLEKRIGRFHRFKEWNVCLCILYSAPGHGTVVDSMKLEQSLCHVLMDKAILNCLLLLDKADMESQIKTLAEQQTRFDYSGMVSSIFFEPKYQ